MVATVAVQARVYDYTYDNSPSYQRNRVYGDNPLVRRRPALRSSFGGSSFHVSSPIEGLDKMQQEQLSRHQYGVHDGHVYGAHSGEYFKEVNPWPHQSRSTRNNK